jgi:hypothetical protein
MATLSELRDQVRQRSDQENSKFIGDAELNGYINDSYLELYDILVSKYEDYYSATATFTLSGTNSYALPSNLYKLRGVDFQINAPSDWTSLKPFNFMERNSRNRIGSRVRFGIRDITYRMMGSNLLFLPETDCDGTYRIWYIPKLTQLVSDSDALTGVLDFDEYIVVDAAIKCLGKEESDATLLMATKQALLERVKTMSADRDAGMPQRVGDVSMYADCFDEFFPR